MVDHTRSFSQFISEEEDILYTVVIDSSIKLVVNYREATQLKNILDNNQIDYKIGIYRVPLKKDDLND